MSAECPRRRSGHPAEERAGHGGVRGKPSSCSVVAWASYVQYKSGTLSCASLSAVGQTDRGEAATLAFSRLVFSLTFNGGKQLSSLTKKQLQIKLNHTKSHKHSQAMCRRTAKRDCTSDKLQRKKKKKKRAGRKETRRAARRRFAPMRVVQLCTPFLQYGAQFAADCQVTGAGLGARSVDRAELSGTGNSRNLSQRRSVQGWNLREELTISATALSSAP